MGIQVPGFASYRLQEKVEATPDLRFPLFVKPLQADGSAGIAQASVVQDVASLAERVAFIHERFGQGAIAEEFVEGRELYVGVLATTNPGDPADNEMVFDKRKTRPEERIATQFAKWDEAYRERKGIRNVLARPISKAVRGRRSSETCRMAYRALWLRDYARLDLRLTDDGGVWVLEANANPFISYGHDMANAAAKAGMEYYDFIQRIVDAADSAI